MHNMLSNSFIVLNIGDDDFLEDITSNFDINLGQNKEEVYTLLSATKLKSLLELHYLKPTIMCTWKRISLVFMGWKGRIWNYITLIMKKGGYLMKS